MGLQQTNRRVFTALLCAELRAPAPRARARARVEPSAHFSEDVKLITRSLGAASIELTERFGLIRVGKMNIN